MKGFKMNKERNKCRICGRVINQYASECKKCHDARMAEVHDKARAIVKSGKCPKCGSGLHRNNSMHGWWQCDQFGAEGFRKDNSKPSCNFQTFTE